MYRVVALIFLTLLSGCVSVDNIYKSVYKVKQDKTQNQIIIDDLLNFLERYYPAAKTTFILNIDNSKDNLIFAQEFENRFRNAGYAIANKGGAVYGIPLSWKIDRVGQLIRTTYYIGKSVVTRVYKRVGYTIIPIGAFSAYNMPKNIYNFKLLNEFKQVLKTQKHLAVVNVKSLRVRAKPSIKSKIVGSLKYGQKIEVTSKVKYRDKNSWIKLKNPNGYIMVKYLKDLNAK